MPSSRCAIGLEEGAGASSFKSLRLEVAAFMVGIAEDEVWQDVFACCQELVSTSSRVFVPSGVSPPSGLCEKSHAGDASPSGLVKQEPISDDEPPPPLPPPS